MASKLARFSWLPGGLAATVVLAIGRLVAPDASIGLEAALYDRVQRSAKIPAAQDIVIVGIDASSVEKLGEWPWARDVQATLIERLRADGASVIAWTAPFRAVANGNETQRVREALSLLESSGLGNSEQAVQLRALMQTSVGGVDPDTHLAAAMRAHGNVVLPVELRLTRGAPSEADLPPDLLVDSRGRESLSATQLRAPKSSFLDAASAIGHIEFAADPDGVVRADAAVAVAGDKSIPSLSVAIAARALDVAPPSITVGESRMRIGERTISLDRGQRLLPQFFEARDFKVFPYWQVLSGEIGAGELQGKIVLIGFSDSTATEATSIVTPMARDTSIAIAVASTTSGILNDALYSRSMAARLIEWGAIACVILLAAFALPAAGLAVGTIATAVVVAVLAVAEIGLLSSARMWPQLMLPCVAMLAGFSTLR